jgi:hypothetical protein
LCQERPHEAGQGKERSVDASFLSTTLTIKGEPNLLSATIDRYLNKEVCDEWKTYVLDLFYKINQLRRFERGKSLLALTAATHVILLVLIAQILTAFR